MNGTSIPLDLQISFQAIDVYLDEIKKALYKRLIIGRRSYLDAEEGQQRWLRMPIGQLQDYLIEEELDLLNYKAFIFARQSEAYNDSE